MRRLRLRETGEDGAVAVLVAILLGSGMLLGVGALVIDVGLIAVERTQIQNGADAASWALARDCATRAPGCDASGLTAAKYAQANVKDGSVAVVATASCPGPCGPQDTLPSCPPLPPGLPSSVAQVRTSTRNDDGSTLLPPVFARTLDQDYDGTNVITCARVVWGVATQGTATGLAIGMCEWKQLAGAPEGEPDGAEVHLSQNTQCGSDPIPQFAWVGGPDCTADVTVGDVVTPSDGAACGPVLADARDAQTPILVPIISEVAGGGYHVIGLGGFVVTDYILVEPGDIGGLPPAGCAPDVTCVTGHFTRIVVPAHDTLPGTTTDYGAAVLSRVG